VLVFLSSAFSWALLIYYAITSEIITSIAHLCAIIMGGSMGILFVRLVPRQGEDKTGETDELITG
jgi:hypothetical protein